MPLTIPVGNGIASLVFQSGADPEPMVCTVGVRPNDGGPPLSEETCERIAKEWIGVTIPTLQSSQIALKRVELLVAAAAGGNIPYSYTVTTGGGGSAGNGVPQNTAYLARKQTLLGGRRGRGRMFIPGVPEPAVDADGFVSASYTGPLEVALNNWRLGVKGPVSVSQAGDPATMVLFHGPSTTTTVSVNGNIRTTTVTTSNVAGPGPTDIEQFLVDNVAATQRRRLR